MDQVSVGVLVSAKALQRLRSNQVDRRLEALLIANHSVGTKLFFFNLKGVDLAAHKLGERIEHLQENGAGRPSPIPKPFTNDRPSLRKIGPMPVCWANFVPATQCI